MTKEVVMGLYNNLAILAKKHTKLQKAFDNACQEQYSTRYNDCDFSIETNQELKWKIIDTLDDGTDSLPFEEFDKMMQKAKTIQEAKK